MKFRCNLHKTYWGRVALLVIGLLAVASVAWATLIVAAYKKGTEKAPVPPASAVETPSESPSPSSTLTLNDQRYLEHVKERTVFQDDTDQKLIETAEAICVALDAGATVEAILLTAVDSGVPEYDAGWLVAGAVVSYCPEFTGKLEEAIQ